MKNFIHEVQLLVGEERILRQKAQEKLGWTSDQWYDRFSGRVALKPAERIALEVLTKEIREEKEEAERQEIEYKKNLALERAHTNNI